MPSQVLFPSLAAVLQVLLSISQFHIQLQCLAPGLVVDWLPELRKVAQLYLVHKGFLVWSFVIWNDLKG